ncbi:hypothetical protein AN0515.2 [Aspergillus nidulans FGSC A4]|uniref:NACHT domain protein (AFU_orthologue AFUA_4G09460) n=1 Tax=Emericella nidulans (strain FGSC A4 / ATCC 38163 / CBS 112.46 / NRRL 194 / M139) TaxID=227321 RepID=Q5BG15_EMENI|nr:hypothetical protein [Aspergillus nidulans FGSC A4]EAA66614.1 hypothetical protein AN0515.2 [Aspergillus nidulans FGSC A4]CBF89329.1 TPA: NACHT domain protein (AFU_orthologue; AFUA_4G09460) [Aspergillus nidulans FGSC A4]|eukprot:XP_658119.1 hypothetical protein AN0515.2 [Aspergillus nidulans FGSC A4]
MAVQVKPTSNNKLSALWQAACADYAKQTGKLLADGELPELRGPEDLSRQLDAEKDNFDDFRMKQRPLLHAIQTVIYPFKTWGSLIAATSFPPASAIMSTMMYVIRGVRKVSEAFNMISDLFRKLGHFALRLDLYKGVQLSKGMKMIIVKVLANILRVCAASQKLALQILAWQVVTQQVGFAEYAEEFCLKEDPDNTYTVWRKLLLDYLTKVLLQGTCFIIDGLDEADPKE